VSPLDTLATFPAAESLGAARRLAFQPEEHRGFVFVVVDAGPLALGVLGGFALLAVAALALHLRRRHRARRGSS
jgi:hypothetical protein